MKKLKIAVIGTGAIAQVAHLPIWHSFEDVEVVALCDKNKNKMQWLAERFNIEHCFTDIAALLKLDDLDAVDVCVPTASHMDVGIAALSAGKHVLVEKPMALNFAQAKNMADAAKKYQRKLMVAMNVRFRQDSIILNTFTKQGELGEIFYAKTGWLRRKQNLSINSLLQLKKSSGGGVFMDLGTQMLDVGLWLMGNPKAKTVKASLYSNLKQLPDEDSAAAFINLENGATLTIEVSWTLLSESDFFYTNLFGTNGSALLNPLRVHKELHGNLVNVTPTKRESKENLYKKSYKNELRHFTDCLLQKIDMISSGEEQLERMKILDAVYQSAQSGKEITLKS